MGVPEALIDLKFLGEVLLETEKARAFVSVYSMIYDG
jgi:hypothetical protein